MHTQLANVLATTTRDAVRLEKQREINEYRAQLRQARIMAKGMIERLPNFLKNLAELHPGYNRAYIVAQYQYRPYHRVPYSRLESWPSRYYRFSPSTTNKYLIGIPHHIAIWGLSEGLTVQVNYARDYRADGFFESAIEHDWRDDLGIVFSW